LEWSCNYYCSGMWSISHMTCAFPLIVLFLLSSIADTFICDIRSVQSKRKPVAPVGCEIVSKQVPSCSTGPRW
jgi:hypothetical protein